MKIMCFIRILLVSSLTLLINACFTYNDFFGKIEAETKFQPIGGKPIEVLQGSGTVIYVCVSDDKGTFYKFENMNVELFSKFKLLQAEISGPNQSLVYRDGSKVESLLPLKWGESESGNGNLSLPDVLFSVSDVIAPKGSKISGLNYVTRYGAKGGIPSFPCGEDQIGKVFKVPFSANYILWK